MAVRRLIIGMGLTVSLLLAKSASGGGPYQFYSTAPCRLADTRDPQGPYGGPVLASGSVRSFPVVGSRCAIPTDAQAAVLNLTAVDFTQGGFLIVWPFNTAMPTTSNINVTPGQGAVANGCVVGLGAGASNISVTYGTQVAGTTNVIIDITGYYK